MKLTIPTLTLTLLLTTPSTAIPTTTKRANSCGASTFSVDTTSQATPAHCQTLITLLSSAAFPSYNWPLENTWKSMLTYDTCSFTARTTRSNTRGQIGNEDVYDLLRDTLRDGNRGGLVGAKGVMNCGGVEVEWRVLRSSGNEGGTFIPGLGRIKE
ncbi:putative necrosis-inducing factor-domain-containing protein [Podospora fimiseda]|uniref:Necrosis-inducing factor-domain-containing protein n=1 Tax=Podospora fimiseda TaxID=252190 RepID=A0AAN7BQI1_9PEZI|nr:putative necrosis-inducing factor-domain-containing protein [Podospora fimiseda]